MRPAPVGEAYRNLLSGTKRSSFAVSLLLQNALGIFRFILHERPSAEGKQQRGISI
jgi:hypothetical protein